jgi:CheY-like chemotaxis protein
LKRIVIIEDNAMAANIYQGTLVREGFSVEVATNGEAGLASVVGSPPDLVLLDLMLPKIDGVELLRRIRATEGLADLPVVVMSNSYTQARLDSLNEAGASRIVSKAKMSPKQLLAIVQEVLGGGGAPASQAMK